MELKVRHLSKKYGDKLALNNVSFSLQEGIYGLLGPNGSGKSTLFKILVQLLEQSEGTIHLDEKPLSKWGKDYRSILGFMPQYQSMYHQFNAYDFLAYLSQVKGIDKKIAQKRIDHLLTVMELKDVSFHKIKTFSGGMKQRLLLCATLLNDPKIILLDEPTAGLDPKQRIHVRNLISEIAMNKIVIIATHVVSDVEFIADEFLLLKEGQLIQKGSMMELQNVIIDKVKEQKVDIEEYKRMEQEVLISNVSKVGALFQVRFIDLENKYMNANIVDPTLEDIYLYYFRT